MQRMRHPCLHSAILACAVLSCTSPGSAASSAWADADGGRVRLVTSGVPDAQGRLRGALQVELRPGWKTYWRDPGEAGVPPSIDVSANPHLLSATLDFPAPERHGQGDLVWAGYGGPVMLPVTFQFQSADAFGQFGSADASGQLGSADASGLIDASVFLGLCETICIPLQAELVVDTAHDADAPQDAALVGQAFAALPQPASAAFGVSFVSAGDDGLVVEMHAPEREAGELFLAGSDDYAFGVPEAFEEAGRRFFRIPLVRSGEAPSGAGFPYTLVTASGAVSGLLPAF
jgi:DsbC/DsbD-like thiol-disulfide interchange protein